MKVIDSAALKARLAEVGADFRWSPTGMAYEVGPELIESASIIPVMPVFGSKLVNVNEGALYYVHGEAHDLYELIKDIPEWEPEAVRDVVIGESATIELEDHGRG